MDLTERKKCAKNTRPERYKINEKTRSLSFQTRNNKAK